MTPWPRGARVILALALALDMTVVCAVMAVSSLISR